MGLLELLIGNGDHAELWASPVWDDGWDDDDEGEVE